MLICLNPQFLPHKMKVKKSPLELKNFSIKSCQCAFIYNDEIEQTINFNFDVLSRKDQSSSEFAIKLEANIKPKNKDFGGFAIKVKSLNVFEISETNKLDEDQLKNLKMISSLNIAIANLRGFLLNITNYYGQQYILPAISIPDLINAKIKEEEKEQEQALELKK